MGVIVGGCAVARPSSRRPSASAYLSTTQCALDRAKAEALHPSMQLVETPLDVAFSALLDILQAPVRFRDKREPWSYDGADAALLVDGETADSDGDAISSTYIRSIDDRRRRRSFMMDTCGLYGVKVSPGTRKLEVAAVYGRKKTSDGDPTSLARADFTFDAAMPSHELYRVRAERRGATCVAWIEDISSAGRVGEEISEPCVDAPRLAPADADSGAVSLLVAFARVFAVGLIKK